MNHLLSITVPLTEFFSALRHKELVLELFRAPKQHLTVSDILGFPGGSDGKASACNAGDPGSIPGSGRSPGEGNGNPLQHSCLENPMDGGA